MDEIPRVTQYDSRIAIELHGQVTEYPVQRLPDAFIDWQVAQRISLFEALKTKNHPSFFPPHLPALITVDSQAGLFPANVACKGIGLVALDAFLMPLATQFEAAMTSDPGSMVERVKSALLLYGFPDRIDRARLGGLEIFETRTFKNITNYPFVSLFFTGSSPSYLSYQIDCIAELTTVGHPFYRFLRAMRGLFEDAAFHFQQPAYPYAVRYHVIAVHDKSLKRRESKQLPGESSIV